MQVITEQDQSLPAANKVITNEAGNTTTFTKDSVAPSVVPALNEAERDTSTAELRALRQKILTDAGVAGLANCASADPTRSVDEMLVDLLCMSYNAAMRIGARASICGRVEPMVKLARTSARLMDSFTQGALVLNKLRNGNKQLVVVQHVAVGQGGQAVIAGSLKQGEPDGIDDDRRRSEAAEPGQAQERK